MDITVTIPDDVWPDVAAAYHATWPDQTETPDEELVRKALVYSVKDTWFALLSSNITNSAAARYNQAAADYNTARQAIDTDMQVQNQQAQDEADVAFPGF
ncbi:hypothetical protein ACFRNJ_11980 [Streptomyces sp. NPDC056721]|uniref:hypothetical protein n=1 Tax=Streptomyces sp. NPDC056721 TaxID=3345923 RepID=UPI0036A3C69C